MSKPATGPPQRDHLVVLIQRSREDAHRLIEAFRHADARAHVEWFACPEEAKKYLFEAATRRAPPDLVLAEDEAIGRVKLIGRIREDRRLKYVPFIVLTREPVIPVAVEAGGVSLYVRRPARPEDADALVATLSRVLPISG